MLMAEAGIQANIPAMADYVDHWHAAPSRDPALIASAAQAHRRPSTTSTPMWRPPPPSGPPRPWPSPGRGPTEP